MVKSYEWAALALSLAQTNPSWCGVQAVLFPTVQSINFLSIKREGADSNVAPSIYLPWAHLVFFLFFSFLMYMHFFFVSLLDSLIVAVKPKPPPKHVRDGFEDEDDDDNLVRIE